MNIKRLLIAASITIGLIPSIASAAPAIVTGGTKTATLNVTATFVDPAPIVVNGSIILAGPLDFGTVTLPTSGVSQATAATTFTVIVDNTMPYTIAMGFGANVVTAALGDNLLGATTGNLISYSLQKSAGVAWNTGTSYPATGTGVGQVYNISSAITLESGVGTATPATLADTYSDTHTITLTY